LGHYTINAVKRYQKDKGLLVDGVAGHITRTNLEDCIRHVQCTLNHLGFDCGEVDGIFGEKTTKAVTAYQKKKRIKRRWSSRTSYKRTFKKKMCKTRTI